jgi:phosphatidylserine/phosphatidylglycerophosphate/cardiolipin synthase-like enzyme
MHRRADVIAALIVSACIIIAAWLCRTYLIPTPAEVMPAQVMPADGRSYSQVVHSHLAGARKSIDVILYQTRFYFQYPGSASNRLLAELARAAGRGVGVRLILEQADWNVENSEENRDVYNALSRSGVDIYFDPLSTTSHSKLAIIDGAYTILGSTNWSHYSLDRNDEAAVVIHSDDVAGEFTGYFEDLIESSTVSYESELEVVPAGRIGQAGGRYAIVRDVPDTAFVGSDGKGVLAFGEVELRLEGRPLQEILAVDSLFFSRAIGESVRVVVRTGAREGAYGAADVEMEGTRPAMAQALRAELGGGPPSSASTRTAWVHAEDVRPASNRDYAPEVRRLIQEAGERIWIAMLDARYYEETPRTASLTKGPDQPASLTNVVLEDLMDAARRGVDVRLVCDMGWRGSPPPERVDFMRRLRESGARVYEDSPEVTTHAKLLIVDSTYTVVGSTNWSYHALEENNETSVVVQSAGLNRHYAGYIEDIIARGRPFEP